jgi:hypothetical protein
MRHFLLALLSAKSLAHNDALKKGRSVVYNYRTYDLRIRSSLSLPELTPQAGADPDVVIRLGPVARAVCPERVDEHCFAFSEKEFYLSWDRIGRFLIRNGDEIIVDPLPGIDGRSIRLPLLGTVLALLLHQRGVFTLHASAVDICGGAVAFLGNKGWGKSTLAAALYGRGHAFVADDIVALTLRGSEPPSVAPGFPQFKLYPDAVAHSLGDNPDDLAPLVAGYEKRARRVTERFSARALPLTALCILSIGPVPGLTTLEPHEALPHLIAHTYVARFGKQLLAGPAALRHLRQCASLLNNVPVYLVQRPPSLATLQDVARLIEDKTLHMGHMRRAGRDGVHADLSCV